MVTAGHMLAKMKKISLGLRTVQIAKIGLSLE